MHGIAPRAARGGALVVVVCALLLPSGARSEEGGGSPPSSLATFDELYGRLTAAAEDGGPGPEVAASAEELRFALRKELIRRDAEIEVLKLEAARFAGEPQQEALDALVRAAAARERQLWIAIRQLERLAGQPALEPAAEPAGEDKKRRGFSITFEAEDPVDEPDP